MEIYLTRHSQTLWNVEKRLQGHLDSPLTQEGIDNALALKNHFNELSLTFHYIYSSPIPRAYQTAQILFEQQKIIPDERIREMNFGDFEGMKIEELLKNNRELYSCLWYAPEKFERIPNGESYDEVIKRVRSFLKELQNLPHDAKVMIVTHGMCFVVILATMLGLPKNKWTSLNQRIVEGCSLTCVEERKGIYTLLSYNEHYFLPHTSHANFTR